jgi:predicted LPLAT superfamily acyltransferase
VNEPHEMLFALKEEILKGTALALQCDRPEHASRSEAFEFLGARRIFPFTIYSLSLIFNRPVLLSVGIPDSKGGGVLYSSPRFDPSPEQSKEENLARAKEHFQDFLRVLEGLLRKDPCLWFNFSPMMSTVAPVGRILP